MYLYHYTSRHDIAEIVKKGLLFGSEVGGADYAYGTGPINGVLEKYKPKHLPSFMNRDQCIFFHPICKYQDFGRTEIKIDHTKLSQEKLFVADLHHAQQIWNDTVDASYSGETSDIPLTESARNYWHSIVPLDVYMQNTGIIQNPEVLYFGKIPFKHLEVTTTLHPLAQKIFGWMGETYTIKRWGSVYGQIFTKDTQYFSLEILPFHQTVTLSSKTGHIEEQVILLLEKNLSFKEKKVYKNGERMKIMYKDAY